MVIAREEADRMMDYVIVFCGGMWAGATLVTLTTWFYKRREWARLNEQILTDAQTRKGTR